MKVTDWEKTRKNRQEMHDKWYMTKGWQIKNNLQFSTVSSKHKVKWHHISLSVKERHSKDIYDRNKSL